MVRSLRQSWKTGRAWSYRFRIERWFRMRWCAAANRARWLPEPWFCYFGCPNCQPDFGEGQEGKRRYREWRAMEDELLAELAERSQSRTPGGPRPRVNERRVGDGASGSGVATGISPNPASRRPLGQAALLGDQHLFVLQAANARSTATSYWLCARLRRSRAAMISWMCLPPSRGSRQAVRGVLPRAGVSSYSPGRDLGVGAADDEAVNV
jgi:hypothetical protein